VVNVEIGVFAVDGDEDFGLYVTGDIEQVGTAGVARGV
jgi:hypothetical protein